MKLYDSARAPNPRRVRIFLAEKGLVVDKQPIDLAADETHSEGFLAINPMGAVPVLALDDGSYICESIAICRYFEQLHPTPALMGVDAKERAMVEMWNLRVELYLYTPIAQCFYHSHRYFKDTGKQIPRYAKQCREQVVAFFVLLNNALENQDYIAGEGYTIADISALCAIDFARVVDIRLTSEHAHLLRWHERVRERPSAEA